MKSKKIIAFFVISIFIIAVAPLVIFAQEAIVLSGGTIGGNTNLEANALASIGKLYCNLLPTVIITPTMAQVDVLEANQAAIATTPGYLTYQAYYGEENWEGKPFKEIRSLLHRPSSLMQIAVLKESPIQEIRDLIGKKVAIGKKGFSAAFLGEKMFEVLGIDITPVYVGHADSVAGLVSGKMDAYLATANAPSSAFIELSETAREGIRIINISEEDMATILEELPFFISDTVEPVYKGMEEAATVPAYVGIMGCRAELPEEVAYCLTKAFWEHLDFAALQWAAIGELKLEDVSSIKGVAPWHIGAYRYYKEVGLEIPSDMIPPEAIK